MNSTKTKYSMTKQDMEEKLKRDILTYYSEKKGSIPAYYYFKQRNNKVMDFVLNNVSTKNFNLKGDVNEYFR